MKKGIFLDIGGGERPRQGFVNMDYRDVDGVDVVHNCLKFPWPFKDGEVEVAMCSHLVEHITPDVSDPRVENLIKLLLDKNIITDADISDYVGEYVTVPYFVRFMDEVWRVLKPGGQFGAEYPIAGSVGYWQDPTHVNPISSNTWRYFAREDVSGLWNIYKPKPWKILQNSYSGVSGFGSVVLEKLEENA